jgi:hypothetical protein
LKSKLIKHSLAALAVLLALASLANAQQISGVPGSLGAVTTSVSGKQLPRPDPKFDGVIEDHAFQSKAWFAPRIIPARQAPQ